MGSPRFNVISCRFVERLESRVRPWRGWRGGTGVSHQQPIRRDFKQSHTHFAHLGADGCGVGLRDVCQDFLDQHLGSLSHIWEVQTRISRTSRS